MADSFLHLPDDERRKILARGAQQLGRNAQALEKDVWVCWVLEQLWTMLKAGRMAFKGGTSLSKVYRAIDRFSEDIDVTLDYRGLDPEFNPFAEGVSKNKLKNASERLRALMKGHVDNVVVPALRKRLTEVSAEVPYEVAVSDNSEKVWVRYRSVVEGADGYMKDEVLIEFGGRNITEPNEKHIVAPYLADFVKELSFPVAAVDVLVGARTFWEKATLVHVECHRSEFKVDASRMSRHWYDLYMLADHDVGRGALANRALLDDVVKHKKVFFHVGYANYDACLAGALRLVPQDDSALRTDYQKMVSAGMFFGTVPAFDDVIARLQSLEAEINAPGSEDRERG